MCLVILLVIKEKFYRGVDRDILRWQDIKCLGLWADFNVNERESEL